MEIFTILYIIIMETLTKFNSYYFIQITIEGLLDGVVKLYLKAKSINNNKISINKVLIGCLSELKVINDGNIESDFMRIINGFNITKTTYIFLLSSIIIDISSGISNNPQFKKIISDQIKNINIIDFIRKCYTFISNILIKDCSILINVTEDTPMKIYFIIHLHNLIKKSIFNAIYDSIGINNIITIGNSFPNIENDQTIKHLSFIEKQNAKILQVLTIHNNKIGILYNELNKLKDFVETHLCDEEIEPETPKVEQPTQPTQPTQTTQTQPTQSQIPTEIIQTPIKKVKEQQQSQPKQPTPQIQYTQQPQMQISPIKKSKEEHSSIKINYPIQNTKIPIKIKEIQKETPDTKIDDFLNSL